MLTATQSTVSFFSCGIADTGGRRQRFRHDRRRISPDHELGDGQRDDSLPQMALVELDGTLQQLPRLVAVSNNPKGIPLTDEGDLIRLSIIGLRQLKRDQTPNLCYIEVTTSVLNHIEGIAEKQYRVAQNNKNNIQIE